MMNCGKPVGAVKDVIGDEVNHFKAFLGGKIEKCSKKTETLPEGKFYPLVPLIFLDLPVSYMTVYFRPFGLASSVCT